MISASEARVLSFGKATIDGEILDLVERTNWALNLIEVDVTKFASKGHTSINYILLDGSTDLEKDLFDDPVLYSSVILELEDLGYKVEEFPEDGKIVISWE